MYYPFISSCERRTILKRRLRKGLRHLAMKATAGSVALLLYSFTTGLPGILFEYFFAGVHFTQILWVRAAYNCIKFMPGGICAWIDAKLKARMMGDSNHPFRRAMVAGLALSVYQIPIYVSFSVIVGVETRKITTMILFFLVNNQFFGGVYDYILTKVETIFNAKSKTPL